jgi:hypothetical protein
VPDPDEESDGAADGNAGSDLGAYEADGVADLVGFEPCEGSSESGAVGDADEVESFAQFGEGGDEFVEVFVVVRDRANRCATFAQFFARVAS